MTADWNKPGLSSTKSGVLTEVKAIATSAVKLDPSGDSNIPIGAKYWDSTYRRMSSWNGSAFANADSPIFMGRFWSEGISPPATDRCLFALQGGDSSLGGVTAKNNFPAVGDVVITKIATQRNGTTGTLTVNLYKDGVDTGQSVSLPNGQASGVGTLASPVTFASGEKIQIAITNVSGGGTAVYVDVWAK